MIIDQYVATILKRHNINYFLVENDYIYARCRYLFDAHAPSSSRYKSMLIRIKFEHELENGLYIARGLGKAAYTALRMELGKKKQLTQVEAKYDRENQCLVFEVEGDRLTTECTYEGSSDREEFRIPSNESKREFVCSFDSQYIKNANKIKATLEADNGVVKFKNMKSVNMSDDEFFKSVHSKYSIVGGAFILKDEEEEVKEVSFEREFELTRELFNQFFSEQIHYEAVINEESLFKGKLSSDVKTLLTDDYSVYKTGDYVEFTNNIVSYFKDDLAPLESIVQELAEKEREKTYKDSFLGRLASIE
ncbi:hypothetical protein NMR59_001409 [Vibrio cholerae]|uniref:hypothetical protein n=1 Tax=Vibrio harveyi group TaxID=717610 RepID=UPI00111E7356|nr:MULTISPECIES: hypothetical protein [Vibrio harveyi group]EJL6505006.1 hypothetical protein [Vibrio cholerae]TNZ92785.1 hypothetical protein CGK37_11440 [Vibrio parahaemolyticus]TOA13872.1 hypothetical protein CGK34_10975 [Vibrio parahaemolyticus]WAE59517.1 hypothetical protein OPR71_19800 [Vibrio alginolyticus]HBC3553786.1 hypothetical protein [Vibrio parahaemolyticus]